MHLLLLVALWMAIFVTALAGPPLLDDADATHAQAAQAMVTTGDWVTLHVDGIRYLEKAPLPYWIAAVSLKFFGGHAAFAVHLPLALTVLGLALLGYVWSRRVFGSTAALYTGLFVLTSAGVFLFTRIFLPDALLSLLLALTLYFFERSFEEEAAAYPFGMWAALALATLTKGLIAPVFFVTTAMLTMTLTGRMNAWRKLRPFSGALLFLAIAAPWHVLASLRNTGGAGGHGFFWFYFYNEHVARFLGQRVPRDYNKLPTTLYWMLHLVWLFPWSLFAPAALIRAWRERGRFGARVTDARGRTVLLLTVFSAIVLVFFSFSTNQEYYTFPVYLPLLMLLAAALSSGSNTGGFAFGAYSFLGLAIAGALAYGLFCARALPFNADIGSALAHRGVGDYTLSLSHFFDLTGPSFAALRLPAMLAMTTLLVGPGVAWLLHARGRVTGAVFAVACSSAVFLIAAHLALLRFAPMLSSENFAETLQSLEQRGEIASDTQIMILGDQAFGSSLPFYLHRQVLLVDGRTTSMWFGSTFADAPPIFLTRDQLIAQWGTGTRKILFVPLELRDDADRLLGARQVLLQETSGKALYTDRPLDTTSPLTMKAPQ
jgi:4-amino-4-deoxy-L-arabinose transferase-like glycosyltransferase